MSNTSSPHETYVSIPPSIDSTSLYWSDTSWMANLSQAWNSHYPPVILAEVYTGFPEAINKIAATRGMSDESEPTQYGDLECDLHPTDPGLERMLEDFEKSEIEDWKLHLIQFYHVFEGQWREYSEVDLHEDQWREYDEAYLHEDYGREYDEVDLHEARFLNRTIMPFTEQEFQERLSYESLSVLDEALFDKALLDEALLDDTERYEQMEAEFWMMKGVAQMYGMWDDEYWQAQKRGPCWESTYHLGREQIETNAPLQAEHRRDIKKPAEKDQAFTRQILEALWWEQMLKHGKHGTPSVVFWRGLPGHPDWGTEPRETIDKEMGPSMFETTEYLEPDDNSLASSGSEYGQNSVYHELPEEDPDWVKLDEAEHIALPPPPSPIIETYLIEIPKIPEPEIEQDEAWTLIVSS